MLLPILSFIYFLADYSTLSDYSSNDIIGTWTPYKERLKAISNDFLITDYSEIDLENMVHDLNDYIIQGLVLDWPFLSNITQNYNDDCNLLIVEELDKESFHPVFAKSWFSDSIIQKLNSEIISHSFLGRTDLLFKEEFSASICTSNNTYIPISLDFVWGIFLFLIGGVFISVTKLFTEIYYEKYGKASNDQLEDNSKDFQKDIHVLLQFDKILSVSSSKFTFRMKDLCSVVIGVGTHANSYKVQLQNLEKDIHAIDDPN